MHKNGVLKTDCKFSNYDFDITSGKDREDKESMSEVIQGLMPHVSLLYLTKLIGKGSLTIQAVLPARLDVVFLQHQQIVFQK